VKRPLPIRWRLTFWYAALLGAALIVFCVALYFGLRAALFENFEEQVRSEAAFALAGVSTSGDDLTLSPEVVARMEDDDHFIRLFNADGEVAFDTSQSLGGVPVDEDAKAEALAGDTNFSTYSGSDEPLGIVTTPVTDAGRVVGVLQVGSSRGDTDEVLQTVVLALAIAGPLVLLFASLGGYWLAGRALRPVVAITTLAATLDANDLDARIDLDLRDDELGRLASTFNGMLDRIQHAFDRQRQFTGDAAHELRTPLALMRSEVDLALSRERMAREYRRALEGIDGDIDRMTGLVTALLTLARSDSGQLELQLSQFELDRTIGLLLDDYGQRGREMGIELVNEAEPVTIEADEDLLIQMVTNLLDNALAHTPEGGRVSVGCREVEGSALLWVEDTGSGIPVDDQERIFDRFYRVETGRDRARGGAGLGLSIVKSIVDAHSGSIELRSAPAEGTRVEVRLPN
jgi:heavy metal sensor kinase